VDTKVEAKVVVDATILGDATANQCFGKSVRLPLATAVVYNWNFSI
jgi:hypothetical protein